VRDRLGVGPGDRIRWLVTADAVRILRPRKAMSLCGLLRHDGPPVSLAEMVAAICGKAGA
jgi:hypothetical protein